MSLIPWRPLGHIDELFRNEDWLVPAFSRAELTRPAMDVYETQTAVIAEVNIPDFDPEKIDISLENGMLTISGTQSEEKEEKNEKGYWRKEIRKGSFERMVTLPTKVREDAVDAVYEKGILKITMPKTEERKSEKVSIRVKGNG